MGSPKPSGDDVFPGWIECWRLWRHCLCRFGWYPLLLAPLVTCACLLDLYSSTGCDFIRLDVGFVPANDVWDDARAQLGLFSFDGREDDANKWKRAFNNGCRVYSAGFVNTFVAADQTWHVSRIFAYISGISSLVAFATAWLLTITPLPASFFWPGVLLPAVILAMAAGAAKFLFFNAEICTEPLWYVDESSEPVAAQSCEIGESSVFGIASVAAYFFCTILICFRSPQKRALDENFGKRIVEVPLGSTGTPNTIGLCHTDPEQGGPGDVANSERAVSGGDAGTATKEFNRLESGLESEHTRKIKNNMPESIDQEAHHIRSDSSVTWSAGSVKKSNTLGILSPPEKTPQKEKRAQSAGVEWNDFGRPIVVTINDSGHDEPGRSYAKDPSLSYSHGSTTQSSSKSPGTRATPPRPPRHNGKTTKHNATISNNRSGEYDSGSVNSKISKLSFTDTQASDDISGLGMQSHSVGSSARSTPSIVNIPRRSRHTLSGASTSSSHSSSGKKLRYAKRSREDRNDVFLDNPTSGRADGSKRDGTFDYLPAVDEMSASRSLEDHGDLINKCVRDLQLSFAEGGDGFKTM